MKRALLIAAAILAMTMATMAQPEVTWLERHHNFGVFNEKDGKVSCVMRLTNTGNEPLLIIKAQASCGCTGVTFTQEPIMPGDTSTVRITYNPSGRPGQFTKQATIITNTTPNRHILEISGNVIPTNETLNQRYPLSAGDLHLSQGNMPFGEIVKDNRKTQYLSAYNASTDTLLVTASGSKPHIRPAAIPDTVPPGMVTAITVHYLSGYAPLWGLNVDTVTVTSAHLNGIEGPQPASASVLVMAQVMENFDDLTQQQLNQAPVVSIDCDDRIDFGVIPRGETATRAFKITNMGKDRLEIRRLWCPEGEGVTIKADKQEIKRGKTATVTVTVDTSSQSHDGLLNVPLTLMCNDPVNPRVTIKLVGIIEK